MGSPVKRFPLFLQSILTDDEDVTVKIPTIFPFLVNPLMLAAPRSSLIIWMKSFKQKHSWENIFRRNVD